MPAEVNKADRAILDLLAGDEFDRGFKLRQLSAERYNRF
jgi:hypothetical protein